MPLAYIHTAVLPSPKSKLLGFLALSRFPICSRFKQGPGCQPRQSNPAPLPVRSRTLLGHVQAFVQPALLPELLPPAFCSLYATVAAPRASFPPATPLWFCSYYHCTRRPRAPPCLSSTWQQEEKAQSTHTPPTTYTGSTCPGRLAPNLVDAIHDFGGQRGSLLVSSVVYYALALLAPPCWSFWDP